MNKDQPAFPNFNEPGSREWACGVITNGGMTLRDYFAAKAPRFSEEWAANYCRTRGYTSEAKQIADWNYEYADAMLKAREE